MCVPFRRWQWTDEWCPPPPLPQVVVVVIGSGKSISCCSAWGCWAYRGHKSIAIGIGEFFPPPAVPLTWMRSWPTALAVKT